MVRRGFDQSVQFGDARRGRIRRRATRRFRREQFGRRNPDDVDLRSDVLADHERRSRTTELRRPLLRRGAVRLLLEPGEGGSPRPGRQQQLLSLWRPQRGPGPGPTRSRSEARHRDHERHRARTRIPPERSERDWRDTGIRFSTELLSSRPATSPVDGSNTSSRSSRNTTPAGAPREGPRSPARWSFLGPRAST